MKYLFLMFCLVLCSCEVSAPDGSCTLKLSREKLLFNVEGGIDTVTTKESFWLSGFIRIGDTIVNYYPPPMYFLISQAEIINYPYYPYEGDISYLLNEETWYVEGIKSSWFSVYRLDNKNIILSVNKNETRKKRSFGIALDAGDCGAEVDVNQSAE